MEINQKELRKSIRRMNKELISEIPTLNNGGCGWFSYLVSKKLTELNVKHEIIVIDNNLKIASKKETINNYNKYSFLVESKDKSRTSFSHCYIEMENYIFDGHDRNLKLKFKWRGKHSKYKGSYTNEEMRVALLIGNWNKTYNKDKFNPILREYINEYIKLC